MGNLYLLPNKLGNSLFNMVFPADVLRIISRIKVFATENSKNTRRFLKEIDRNINVDEITFIELNEHSGITAIGEALKHLEKEDVGIISEAGCPGIADPGADLVAAAHEKGYRVIPLVGPSSILLALIASGCNGQNFSFNGYLPVKSADRIRALRTFEKQSAQEQRTQIFIETPYRNIALLIDILTVLHPSTLLTIACDITTDKEFIKTKQISEWKKQSLPEINKRPAIFIIFAGSC
ncbi:MAG: SAM-dependent methyltransferase [Culturomica sp.]|jgi:16S rRNA (cytidine1402-2'-O)-methyltransferase|nr:SAM-dependent methyltransferase [Culturomica sp.]